MAESKIQTKIKQKLTKAGWEVLKIIQLSENGYPDLLALKDGRAVWIEVKDTGGTPETLQSYRIKQLNNNGFEAFWTDNPNDDRVQALL